MGAQLGVRCAPARQPVQQPGPRLRRGDGAVAQGEAHCALPEIWPVSVPAPGLMERFIVKLSDPEVPLTVAPMVDPSSAVTCPLRGPKETALRRMSTPPFTAGPMILTWSGAEVSAG